MRIIDIYVFFTAILILTLKGKPLPKFCCWRGLQWRRLHLFNFFTEVIKFYWLMLLLYPGELYRLLGASSFIFRSIGNFQNPLLQTNLTFYYNRSLADHLFYVNIKCYSIKYGFLPVTRRGRCGRDHMVVGFTTACAISSYHH